MPDQSAADLSELTPLLETINWGTTWNTTELSVSFIQSGTTSDSYGFDSDGWSDHEKLQFNAALQAIAAVSGLSFTTVADNNRQADLQLLIDNDEVEDLPFDEQFLGFFNVPDFNGRNSGVFDANGLGWDRSAGGGLEQGGYGYVTITHELLHGLGLAHPHDEGEGGSTIMAGVTAAFDDFGDYDLNQGVFTTMSYNSGALPDVSLAARLVDYDFGYEFGPMALDIAVLQYLYGANMDYETGANSYELIDVNDTGTGWMSIWDAGGTDSIDHSGSANALIDLRAATLQYGEGGGGYVSTVEGIQGGFTIAYGVEIENASAGSGDDVIIGNHVANTLVGNGGDDTMFGGAGDDTLRGGNNDDTLYGETGDDAINAGTGNNVVSGGSGGDDIQATNGTNILRGGSGRDEILGGTQQDTIFGGSGDDTLDGDLGNDVIYGGRGADVIGGGADDDELIGGLGVDQLTGGAGNDTFVFQFLSDSLVGGVGISDVITDFTAGDLIDLSNIDADLSASGNQAFTFIGEGDFTGAGGEVRMIDIGGGDSVVLIDRTGSGGEDMEIILEGITILSADDFIL